MVSTHQHQGNKRHPAGNEFSSDYEHVKESLGQIQGDVSQLLSRTLHAGRSGVSSLGEQATEKLGDVRNRMNKRIDNLGNTISEHPIRNMFLAMGAGYVLMKLLFRK